MPSTRLPITGSAADRRGCQHAHHNFSPLPSLPSSSSAAAKLVKLLNSRGTRIQLDHKESKKSLKLNDPGRSGNLSNSGRRRRNGVTKSDKKCGYGYDSAVEVLEPEGRDSNGSAARNKAQRNPFTCNW